MAVSVVFVPCQSHASLRLSQCPRRPESIYVHGVRRLPAHDNYMQRAIELAQKASGNASPNPLVGCVIVRGDAVVGEGWHRAPGHAHAEVAAMQAAGDQTRGATLYVNLEPCAHHGRTPPCTEAILAAGIERLVYALVDPNPTAHGGAEFLSKHGIDVISGVCEAAALQLNRYYLHHMHSCRPFVIAKFASSLDGRSATRSGHSQWITGASARQRGHQLRQSVDAIVVGAQTVIDDDPQLTVRLTTADATLDAISHPQRYVLDSRGRIPLDRQVLSNRLPGKTCVVTTGAMPVAHELQLTERGIEVLRLPGMPESNHINLQTLLATLGKRDVQSVLIEGGQTMLGSFLDAGLIDEVWAFVAPMLIGGQDALPAIGGIGTDRLDDALRLQHIATEVLGDDLLIRGQVITARNTA